MYRYLFWFPAIAAAAVDVTGVFSLGSGYRWDEYKQSSTISGISNTAKFKKFRSLLVSLQGQMNFNRDFFIRGFATGGSQICHSELVETDSATVVGARNYVFDVGGAVGWHFDLIQKKLELYPEFGYSYTRLKFDSFRYIAVGTPFTGFTLIWTFVPNTNIEISFDYAFAGARRESLSTPGEKITDGNFQGPKGRLQLTHAFASGFSIGASYCLDYLFSQRKNFVFTSGNVNNLKTTWITQEAKVNVGYIF